MKKGLLKFLALSFVAVQAFSVIGCSKEEESSSSEEQRQEYVQAYTDYKLAENGQTGYKVVVDDEANSIEKTAVEELTVLLKEATGATLPVVTDSEVEYTEQSQFLIVGHNDLSAMLDAIPTLDEVGVDGYEIANYGKSLVISGASKTSYGTLYGVYEYLARQIDFEVYAEDEVVYTESDSLNLIEIDLVDKPDISQRMSSAGVYSSDLQFRGRMRHISVYNVYASYMTPYHNSFTYLPPDTYMEEHPKCYAADGSQLCYTAGGDEEEYEWMQQTVLAKMIDGVAKENKDEVNVTITIQDVAKSCNCETCTAEQEQYKSAAGSVVKFCNDLSEKMNAYLAENDIKKRVNILFFAYLAYEAAPCTVEGDVYTPTIYCADNVYPIICPINALYEKPLNDKVGNASSYNLIRGWSVAAKRISFWTYSTNFLNYTVPYDPFTCMQENYKFIASCNPLTLFDQGQSGVSDYCTGFTMLKYWLQSKLGWDTTRNVEALTQDFFKHYFGIASEEMYAFYTAYRTYLTYLTEEMGYQTKIFNALHTKYFPIGTLNSWNAMIDKALAKIEPLKGYDMETFNKLNKRISAEKVMVEYLTLKLYGPMFSNKEYEDRENAYYKLCGIAGVTMLGEHKPMENVF